MGKGINKTTNTATSKVSDELFTEGMVYECTSVYVEDSVPVVDILCDTGDLVSVLVNDENFSFTLRNIEKTMDKKNIPYIHGKYNPEYGDNRICVCGHAYARHFDSYDDMEAVGCKYCGCYHFVEATENSI